MRNNTIRSITTKRAIADLRRSSPNVSEFENILCNKFDKVLTKSASDSLEGFEDDSVLFYSVKLLLVLLLILSFLWVSDNNGLVLWVRCNVMAIINNI